MIEQKEIDYMNECTSRDLLLMLTSNKKISLEEAMHILYNSNTYSKLQDPRTRLFFQSPIYIYDVLEEELTSQK